MRRNPFRKPAALAAALAALCLLPSCMGAEKFVQSVFLTSDVRGAYVVSPADHFCSYAPETLNAQSGSLSFYVDERTGSAAVYDAAAGELWSALPTYSNRTAAVVTAEAFNGSATYVLNSQDHAAAFGTVSVTQTAGGAAVVYTMADNESTARKQPDELSAGDIYLRVPVTYAFANGRLTVSVDLAEVVCAPGLILYNLSLVPDFGAIDEAREKRAQADPETTTAVPAAASAETTTAASAQAVPEEETTAAATEPTAVPAEPVTEPAAQSAATSATAEPDFLLVPDGCGAAIYPAGTAGYYPELDLCVYGSDDSVGRSACVGAFGVKRGGGAFVCVMTQGEELAVIRTLRQAETSGSGSYLVYARYNVTPVFNYNGEMAYGLMYDGVLSQTYTFLNGGSADCAGMASAARELLVHAGFLTSSSVKETTLPVVLTLAGSVEGTKETLLTDLEQAEAAVSMLRAKGVTKVNLLLDGFLTGGLEKNGASAARIAPCEGGAAALASLCDYAEKQGYDVYLGKDLLTADRGGNALRDLAGKKRTFAEENPYAAVGSASYARKLVSWTEIPKNASAFLNAMEKTGVSGFALTDLNAGLCADYTVRLLDRSVVSEQLSEIAASFSTIKKLSVSGANGNVLRYADMITEIPYTTSAAATGYCEAVPFLQMILHGSYLYSGAAAVNAETDRLTLLKAVEYGGAPCFSWTGSARTDSCYEAYLPACAEFCTRAAEELDDLVSLRITDHYRIAEGIYCTEYGSGIRVYVNYNNYSVAVGTISVPPYDYIRVD
ncbi:MAG: hypothetical protein IJK89_00670 [Clostridia bacterium]|nr:hypothetical protein [Clostridia bacterium]